MPPVSRLRDDSARKKANQAPQRDRITVQSHGPHRNQNHVMSDGCASGGYTGSIVVGVPV
jgi:hypothetical protein